MAKVTAVMCCFNRVEKTLSCISTLAAACYNANISLEVILIDDGSTDSSGDIVKSKFNFVNVHKTSGGLYWCKSMNLGMRRAMDSDFDYLLLLNDDTKLFDDSLIRLAEDFSGVSRVCENFILVGNTVSELTGLHTYGGFVRKKSLSRVSFSLVLPDDEFPKECVAMNGNIVLLSRSTFLKVGCISDKYEHAFGDIDYSLDAAKKGVKTFVARGFHGYCERNDPKGTYHDPSSSRRARLKNFLSVKGVPIKSWFIFTRKHGGPFWVVSFLKPYFHGFLAIGFGRKF